jgi:cellulose synthase/poly-beta-1,6-N-acetylglucosamine synthase-like glycosyltransferase
MLTRFMYLAAGWFAISLFATLAGGHRLRKGDLRLSLGWLAVVLVLGDVWALYTFGSPPEILFMTAAGFVFGVAWILLLEDWNAFGQVTWAMTLLSTFLFIAYSFMVTVFTPLSTISFMIALDFFLIEAVALLMAMTHAYESLDLFCRIDWRRKVDRIPLVPGYAPMVSLHVPAYNEPPEVVRATLNSLARLDYPNYEVLVVDNNTPGEENWIQIRNICQALGPKFRFIHLDKWPGYKSGALNFALAHTAPEAEIIGSIDADYIVKPNFLRELVSAFANPRVGFVQAPQDYRGYMEDPFAQSTYHGYRYFFEVSMPVRNEHNAIIFCGTMGLIRKSALQEIGGWDEWCITEDAEASLRILKRGYESVYIKRSFGRGLMPYTFEGLKKQRFRWCFGGIQILKKHWSALMPWARWLNPQNQLTGAQRYFYLMGGLQWFTDVLNLVFGVFLTLGAISSIFYDRFSIRPLTGPLLIMPTVFLFLHMWRFLWVLRTALDLRPRTALRSMYNFFGLGWVVTLASIQGLIQKRGVFLRTPKTRDDSKVLAALRVTQWESLIGFTFLGFGLLAFIVRPQLKTLWLASLLAWQASLFLAAPYFSLLSIRSRKPTPAMRQPILDRGRPMTESRAARWAGAGVVVLGGLAWVALQMPLPSERPSYVRYQPPDIPPAVLLGIEVTPSPTFVETIVPTASPLPTATTFYEPTLFLRIVPTSRSAPVMETNSPPRTEMTPSDTPTETPSPTDTISPETPTSTDTPSPTDTISPDTPASTDTPSPTDTISPETPTSTDTPSPTDTTSPDTPTPHEPAPLIPEPTLESTLTG